MTTGRINQVAFLLWRWHLPCPLNNQRGKGRPSGHPQWATNAFWVNNNPKMYTHISFGIRDYELQLMAMMTAQSSAICMEQELHFVAHLHQRRCAARTRDILTIHFHGHRVWGTGTRDFCTRSTLLPMHITEENCTSWTSPHKQRNIQPRQNQLPPTRHYVHYAPTPPTNCTSKDKIA